MLFTLYYKDLEPTRAYTVRSEDLIPRFKNWQQTTACKEVKIKNPAAIILFFIGCSKGMRSVMKPETVKPIVKLLKNYAA